MRSMATVVADMFGHVDQDNRVSRLQRHTSEVALDGVRPIVTGEAPLEGWKEIRGGLHGNQLGHIGLTQKKFSKRSYARPDLDHAGAEVGSSPYRFRSQLGDDAEENLITLCADCHAQIHYTADCAPRNRAAEHSAQDKQAPGHSKPSATT